MNLYEKLACARVELQNRNLKKSGHNKFAGFDYYELKDLMPAINEIMAKYKLLGVCSFHADYATLSIFDAEEPESVIVIKSPHAEAELKGCQPIQCLGGEETYQRRYLWMAAMEIVEGDALDANVGRPEKKEKVTQTDDDPLGIGGTENHLPPRGEVCEVCGKPLTNSQVKLSQTKYKKLLCPACQAKEEVNA